MFVLIRKLYDWTLSLAYTPYASLALFVLSFSEASFFPIPPDILLIALCLGNRHKAIHFTLIATLGSIAGGIMGYYIGHFLWWENGSYSNLANFFFINISGFSEELFLKIQEQYKLYGFLIIFTAGFTPIPYKIFTISAGAFDISIYLFLIASIISRGGRFLIVSFLIYLHGEKMQFFIDRYFNLLSIIFTIFLIGGYIIIKLL